MASTGYFGDGPPMRERDFTEAISQRMRVPERLRVGPVGHAHEPEDLSAAYSMHIPDRIALTGIFHIAQIQITLQLHKHKKY